MTMKNFLHIIFVLFIFLGCSSSDEKAPYRPTGVAPSVHLYKVGIHPYLNSQKMFRSYRPILDALEKELGNVRFSLETSKDYAAYEEKLYRGAFDFSLPNPYQTYNAIGRGYHVIAKMKPDHVFRGIFVALKTNHLHHPSQLKGHAVSFPAPTALAATMMPLYFLHKQGIDVNRDIEKRFVGSQDSSILNAYSGDTLAAATWPPPWEAWVRENPKKAADMEVVWQTPPLVNNGFVAREDINASFAASVAKALISLDHSKQGRKLLQQAGFEGFETADDQTYEAVKTFLDSYETTIGAIR